MTAGLYQLGVQLSLEDLFFILAANTIETKRKIVSCISAGCTKLFLLFSACVSFGPLCHHLM